MRVVLIGGGISSSLISVLLRRQYGPNLKLFVFDKARTTGGRMTTTFDNQNNPNCSVDLGAQYLSLTRTNSTTAKFFEQMTNDRIIELLDKNNVIGMRQNPDRIDYTAPRGINSVVDYFFDQAGVNMNLSKHVTHVNFNENKSKFKIMINENQVDEAEIVIVTVPVPQLLTSLKGSINDLINEKTDIKEKLETIKYSCRFAVGLFYPPSVQSLNVPWRLFYVDKNQSDCLRFLAVDNAKRNQNDSPFSLIAHTSVEFGAEHINDDKKKIGEEILEKIFQLVPELPREFSSVKYHKWKYSQVTNSFPGQPGYVALSENPLLLLSGDGFANEGNFEGCIQSAMETVKKIVNFYPSK